MKDKKRFFIRLATVLVLIGIAVLMYFLGRGHTVYLDNKKLEFNGKTYGQMMVARPEDPAELKQVQAYLAKAGLTTEEVSGQ